MLNCGPSKFISWSSNPLVPQDLTLFGDKAYEEEIKGFLCGSENKKSACSAGDPGSNPHLGWSPGEGNS